MQIENGIFDLNISHIEENAKKLKIALTKDKCPQLSDDPWEGKVLSIHLQSNRIENLKSLFDNLEETVSDPKSFEVIVKIDDTNIEINLFLEKEIERRQFTIKYIATPLEGGFFNLWSSMNDMLKLADPDAYFFVNFNDEMYFKSKGWDSILKHYIGLFPDHIFRLRTSCYRFRNYYDFWECGFAPETSAITSRKWIEIGGDWNPCLGPDSFQQCVAFYFGYHERFSRDRQMRDIPITDILIGGEGAGKGLKGDTLEKWMSGAVKAWFRLMSYAMQTEASRRGRKLYAYLWAKQHGLENFTLIDDKKKKIIKLQEEKGSILKKEFSYKLNRLKIMRENFIRLFSYYNYAGAGNDLQIKKFKCFLKTINYQFPIVTYLLHLYSNFFKVDQNSTKIKSIVNLKHGLSTKSKSIQTSIAWPTSESNMNIPSYRLHTFLDYLRGYLISDSINLICIEIHPGYILLKFTYPFTLALKKVLSKIRKYSKKYIKDIIAQHNKADSQSENKDILNFLNIIFKNDYFLYMDPKVKENALKSWDALARAKNYHTAVHD